METSNVFNTPPPEFNQEEVLDILLKYYNIDCSIENLVSDRDQNFKIISKEQIYILKIANSAESKRVLEMQNLAMNYISNKDSSLDISIPIKSRNDEEIIHVEHNNHGYYVRLLSYVDGKFLNQIEPSPYLMTSLGEFLGDIDQLFKGFKHPAANREFIWDARQVDVLNQQLKYSEKEKTLISYFINLFNERLSNQANLFSMSIIHNDGNENNILIGPDKKMKSIIDFGDMIYSYSALEPAVCMAYIAIDNKKPFSLIASLLKGYNSTNPLSIFELESVVYLMCLRMCITVNMSVYRKQLFPENDYISISEDSARKFLLYMMEQDIKQWSSELTEYAKS